MLKTEDRFFYYDRPKLIGPKYYARELCFWVQSIYYKLLMNMIYPKPKEKYQFNVSICGIFKNEAAYLKEWIEYHRIVGVDHFYLYNNLSTDNYMQVLEEYIKQGIVDLIEWPHQQAQLEAYKDCIQKYKGYSKWIGFIDIDEFVVPNTKDNIYSILCDYEKNRPVVMLYWIVFGTSGLIRRDKNGLVTQDFTVCWDKIDNIGKCFFNTRYDFAPEHYLSKSFHHYMWAKFRNRYLPPINSEGNVCLRKDHNPIRSKDLSMQINHYFTKSYEEYAEKRNKGDVFFQINPHDEEYFYRHEQKCKGTDHHIFRFLIKLKRKM